jgi:L-asparagine permease
LIALVIVLTVNMISVKLFGEIQFWAALIKVVALVTFLAGRFTIEGQSTGFSVIADNGGILPTGVLQLEIITSNVIFAYAAVELVGTAAGETENPAREAKE